MYVLYKNTASLLVWGAFQEVRIQDRQVLLGSGFPAPASVPILFEETFYNDQEQSYSILCISRPVEVEPNPAEQNPPPPYCLKSVDDVREFLGSHAQKLEKFIHGFCQTFKEQERKGLRHHIVGTNFTPPSRLRSLFIVVSLV